MNNNKGFVSSVVLGLLIVASIASVVWTYLNYGNFWETPSQKMISMWARDYNDLKNSNQIWEQVAGVNVTSSDPTLLRWFDEHRVTPIQINRSGKYGLDVDLLYWMEGRKYGILVHYDFINQISGDKEEEIVRSVQLGWLF